MTFAYWDNKWAQRVYVNGLRGVGGKTYFAKKGSLAELKNDTHTIPLEAKEDIYSHIEMVYGIPRGKIAFSLLVEKMEGSKKPKTTQRKKQNHSYGSQPMADRNQEALMLDIHTIEIPEEIHIRIDHREPKALIDLLSSHEGANVTVEALELGDIIINDTIVIERKNCGEKNRATDFENSIIENDKRLFTQSERLKIQGDYLPIILLEGSCYENSQRMLVQQIDGAISFLAVIQQLSVLISYNLNHSAYLILKLGTHFQNGLGYDLGLRSKKPEVLLDKKSFVLEGVPGISPKLARELISQFGSIKNIVNASAEELGKIKGLGKKKIEGILETFS